jgi:hypothetical protein
MTSDLITAARADCFLHSADPTDRRVPDGQHRSEPQKHWLDDIEKNILQ